MPRPLHSSEVSPEQFAEVLHDLGLQREDETWGAANKFTPALKPPFTSQAAAEFKGAGLKASGYFCLKDSMSYRSELTTRVGNRTRRQAAR